MSAIKLAGGFDGNFSAIFGYATDSDTSSSNIIRFFSEMGKGAKAAAANVDSSAGVIKKALAGISGGAKGAWGSIGMFGKIGLVVAGISLVVGAVQKYKAHMEALRQEAAENAKAYNESQATLEDYAEKITELKTALDKGTLTETEAYEAKKELYDIQTQLNESYGAAASGIDLVNGSLDEQIDKLHELSLEKANQYMDDFFIIGKTEEELRSVLTDVQKYLGFIGLTVHPKKTRIFHQKTKIRVLGFSFYVTRTGKVIMQIDPKNIKDRRKNIYRCAQLVKAGKMTRAKADELFTSWLAHAAKGDNPHAIERIKKYYQQCMEG